jgi:hypothetical protein
MLKSHLYLSVCDRKISQKRATKDLLVVGPKVHVKPADKQNGKIVFLFMESLMNISATSQQVQAPPPDRTTRPGTGTGKPKTEEPKPEAQETARKPERSPDSEVVAKQVQSVDVTA